MSEKSMVELRAYAPGQTSAGSEEMGEITGDFGRYDIVGKVAKRLRSESIGNFQPVFCSHEGDKRCLVKSDAGDLSDPFRADESYRDTLFIEVPAPEKPAVSPMAQLPSPLAPSTGPSASRSLGK